MKKPTKDQSDKPNKDEAWGLILLLIAFVLFGVVYFYDQKSGRVENASYGESPLLKDADSKNRVHLNHIDRDLKDASLKGEMQKQQTEIENSIAEPIDENEAQLPDTRSTNPLVFDQENHAQKVIEETEQKYKEQSRTNTLDERISAKIARDAWARDYEGRKREEYIKQFLDNAQKQGVDVKLNEDLDVTGLSVGPTEKPIRVPQSMPQNPK